MPRPKTHLPAARPASTAAESDSAMLAYKDKLFAQFARIGKAVASPQRLELLELLCQAPRSVDALAQQAGLTLPNTSRHLQQLRAAGLVECRKQGLYVIYRLAEPTVATFCKNLRALAERRLADVDRLAKEWAAAHPGPEPMALDELKQQLADGMVTLIDVRPSEEFAAGHLPGAISMPLTDLQARITHLPKSKTVVAYCRGEFCIMAMQAVELLQKKGYRAFRIETSVTDWRAQGGLVQRDASATD